MRSLELRRQLSRSLWQASPSSGRADALMSAFCTERHSSPD